MTAASQWLDENRGNAPFFLQVESFDVHEPFDVPEPYASMYCDGSLRDKYDVWPPYQDPDTLAEFMANTTPEELAFIRSQYAGKLTMVDKWFGELLKKLDELDLWNETAVIVTTDHGHDLGERGTFGKQYPHYDSHANIPLMMWHPSYPGNGGTSTGLTSTVDLFPTILQTAGAPSAGQPHGQSLVPLLASEGKGKVREALLYGTFGQGVCATDGEWTIFKSPATPGPLYYYSSAIFKSQDADSAVPAAGNGYFIPGVGVQQWQVPVSIRPLSTENFLFNRIEDPRQERNLWDKSPEQRERMLGLLRDLLSAEGSPQEQYERLGLSTHPE
jgi:hypothetical protein